MTYLPFHSCQLTFGRHREKGEREEEETSGGEGTKISSFFSHKKVIFGKRKKAAERERERGRKRCYRVNQGNCL